MGHAPQVHADGGEKIACCEPGLEAMYPGARDYIHVPRKRDADKRSRAEDELWGELRECLGIKYPGASFVEPNKGAPRKYFVPTPLATYRINCDVVVCPRKREYGPDKNWPHWSRLTDDLKDAGLRVFAGGSAVASQEVHAIRAWEYARPLDATIEAMLSARLVIATDAGLAHLAVLCGRPLLMISHGDGITAPGVSSDGKPYIPIQMDRYERENHTGSPIHLMPHAWDDPEGVTARVLELLG